MKAEDQLEYYDTAYKRWSCHSRYKLLCKLCRTHPPPAMGTGHADPLDGWRCSSYKRVMSRQIQVRQHHTNEFAFKQIHVRKQISIRCNGIEHWVHLRCAGIRQAQYTDTWTCHLHRESGLASHTDITPLNPCRP